MSDEGMASHRLSADHLSLTTEGGAGEAESGAAQLQIQADLEFLPLTVLLLAPDVDVTDLGVLDDADADLEWFARSSIGELVPQPGPQLEPRLQVAVRRSPRSSATWKPFLRALGVDLTQEDDGETESVIIIVRSATLAGPPRWVAFCFGGSSRAIPVNLVDSRFGVVVALNKQAAGQAIPPWRVLPDHAPRRRVLGDPAARVRQVTADVRDGHRHRMVARAYGPSPIGGLRFDTVSDLLHGLGVRTDDSLMRDVTGNRALRFSTFMESLDDFETLGDYLVDVRQRTDYQADWGWIDDIVPVHLRAEADVVLGQLLARLDTDREPTVDLVVPDWATQNEYPSRQLLVAFPGERGQPSHPLLSWEMLRQWLLGKRSTADVSDGLLRTELRASLEGTAGGGVERVRICDLLVAELEIDEEHYVLSEGEVYHVTGSFLTRLDANLSATTWSEFPFPVYTGGNEPDYLSTAKERSGGRLAVLDRQNITLPGQTPFEPCDLVTDDGTLVFAKMKGRSSTFSHLCTQVVATAELLLREQAARDGLRERLAEATTDQIMLDAVNDRLARLEARQPNAFTLCLLLLGTWKGRPDARALPLVSRLILRKTIQRVTDLGFTVELASPVAEAPAFDRLLQLRPANRRSRGPHLLDSIVVAGINGAVDAGPSTSHERGRLVRERRIQVAPGSVVVVRDEEWLVTGVEDTRDGYLLTVAGLSELVRETTATFYERIDSDMEVLDPAQATVRADGSPGYRQAKLWLEASLRKTAVPLNDSALTVSTRMLATPLDYQRAAVRKALDPANLRPRILLADAVGLGKTLEIGMILAELVRRGRGERILIVSPKQVLEQIQHEMWVRFALPFVRLDSVGIQRVRQKLPATRNPFTYFKRVIISIDTLKSDRYVAHLRKQRWDAVVIDESHNLTNASTQNNRLARVLAPNTDALILASATPHNGRAESFAELVRLLEPTAVRADGTLIEDEVQRLVIRRHRNSPDVARTVGADWAERKEPQNFLVEASPEENDVARELDEVWLHPAAGTSPYSGAAAKLFPWTLAKAFLSSPAALLETIRERIKRLDHDPDLAAQREIAALKRLEGLADLAHRSKSGKYGRLVQYLRQIGIGPRSPMRVVIFAERIATLRWLSDQLTQDFGFGEGQVQILRGDPGDQKLQGIVDSFKLESSPIRVLVAGDVASEGVNLHVQCHELIHFDIPWSLIRIEQRNGRIDRYGQRKSPQITTLLLNPDSGSFAGDVRVLSRLLEREREAHTALGDVASLMGKYDVGAEEEEIRKVLAGEQALDDAVATIEQVAEKDPIAALLARITALPQSSAQSSAQTVEADTAPSASPATTGLYDTDVAFLRDALEEVFETPGAEVSARGVRWREYGPQSIVEFVPPADLRQRLEVLPQSYLADRKVLDLLKLATSAARGTALLKEALSAGSTSTWPEAHFLGPMHPVLDWAADRALAQLGRNQVFAVRGAVTGPTVLLQGTLTNRRGQVVASCFLSAEFPNPDNLGFAPVTPYASAAEMVQAAGLAAVAVNPGPVADDGLQRYVAAAVKVADAEMRNVFEASRQAAVARVEHWSSRISRWEDEAGALIQRSEIQQRRVGVAEERRLAEGMAPDRQLIRPLILVLPADHPVEGGRAE